MRVFSFIEDSHQLHPVEVEIRLVRGVPQILVMGGADSLIKESQQRIKEALRASGFEVPKHKKWLVNIKPSFGRKKSRGLDLAVAAAFLFETGQLGEALESFDKLYFYGEIGLDGDVSVPDDILRAQLFPLDAPLVTGEFLGSQKNIVELFQLQNISDLQSENLLPVTAAALPLQRPPVSHLSFSADLADVMAVVAAGGHSLLLAGPAGSGKTTFCEALYGLLSDPAPELFKEIQKIQYQWGETLHWRPFVAPHHTTPPMAMIGGGAPAFPGEITRAHGGVLLLDEFLEFPNKVREALREPIEKGHIKVARRGKAIHFPADFQLLATSNLCPCGNFVPGRPVNCRFSLTRCRSYLERLSGPMVDRFEILGFTESKKANPERQSISEINEKVQNARAFAKKAGRVAQANHRIDPAILQASLSDLVKEHGVPELGPSRRRYQALLRVARTLADLDQSPSITLKHMERARELCVEPFRKLENF